MIANYIIIEDESLAFKELRRLMDVARPEYMLAGWANSMEQASVLLENKDIDLVFSDIRLGDGLSLDLLCGIAELPPVIFTTAYDEYALKAFKANGIDYLLKPIEPEELETALARFERLQEQQNLGKMSRLYDTLAAKDAKTRFLVQTRDTTRPVFTKEIAYIYSEDKYTVLHTFDGHKHLVDHTLDQLEKSLDRKEFFRISRGCIVNIASVHHASKFFSGRLALTVSPECEKAKTVSRTRTNEFLKWLDGIY